MENKIFKIHSTKHFIKDDLWNTHFTGCLPKSELKLCVLLLDAFAFHHCY